MEKLYLILEILKALTYLLRDSDGDGRPDVLDKDENNPEVK